MILAQDPTLEDFGTDPFWLVLIKVVAVFVLLVVMTLFAIVFERKIVAYMQARIGPEPGRPARLPAEPGRRAEAGASRRRSSRRWRTSRSTSWPRSLVGRAGVPGLLA